MISFHTTKRLIGFCMAVVVALFCCVVAYADDIPSDDDLSGASPPASSDSIPDTSPDYESAPSNNENPPSSDTTPPDASSGGDTDNSESPPVPDDDSSSQVEPSDGLQDDTLPSEPEYTVSSALEFLEANGVGISTLSYSEVPGSNIEIRNFPGMHRVFLGTVQTASAVQINVADILPDLYQSLTFENFCFLPVSSSFTRSVTNPGFSYSYDPFVGVLSCSVDSDTAGSNTYSAYCIYNDSFHGLSSQSGGDNSQIQLFSGEAVGNDITVRGFSGLHRVYLGSFNSYSNVSLNMSSILPDVYSSLTAENFYIIPVTAMFVNVSPGSTASQVYNSQSGIYTGFRCFLLHSNSFYECFQYELYCFYNVADEMDIQEPSPDEGEGGTTIIRFPDPHLFWDTDFADFTVSEGLLFLVFCLMAIYGVIKIFRW